MTGSRATAFLARLRQEGGQVLPITALAMVALIGFTGLVVDMGRVWIAQRQLQNAVDATSVAIARNMPDAYEGWSQVPSYSGSAGSPNAVSGYGVTAGNPIVTLICTPKAPGWKPDPNDPSRGTCPADISDQDQPANGGHLCQPSSGQPWDSQPPQLDVNGQLEPASDVGCNAAIVKQSATVKTTFAGLFLPSFNVSAQATASEPQSGQSFTPIDVELVIDSTPSMGYSQDRGDCTSQVTGIQPQSQTKKIDCAKAGMRALLAGLFPCDNTPPKPATCQGNVQNASPELGANVSDPLDKVGLLTYPALRNASNAQLASDRSHETNCSNDNIQVQYPAPYTGTEPNGGEPGYEIVGLSSDYRASSTATSLNTSSDLVKAIDWTAAACPGGDWPGNIFYGLEASRNYPGGGYITYLAGAIAEAKYLLDAAPARPSGLRAQKVIIVLSDGELNDVPFANNGSDHTPCLSAFRAATAAKADGVTIYSIAYNSNLNCTDTSGRYHSTNPNAHTGLLLMQDIASPATGSHPTFFNQPDPGDLSDIFQQIATYLTEINTRLIPTP